ncbi:MAG: PIG-L family deacetylase [Candidatus Peribacteraceae bacterium]|nr:PIG-L family deacetylase [Candidatus Peribacteraceae bacterium]
MNLLVIAAHPDDEVLGCGGTIARYAREGNRVRILILGEGAASRFDDPKDAVADLKTLHEQARAAGKLLGAERVELSKFPDNRFDTVPLLDIVKTIEREVEEFKPEIVCTQHGGDLNIDHERTFRAALTATRPMAGSTVKRVYAYAVPSSTEWAFQKFSPVFRPNVFVDIRNTLENKVEAMALYRGESRAFPHPRSAEALRAHAHYWGSASGVPAAEAFELIFEVRSIG